MFWFAKLAFVFMVTWVSDDLYLCKDYFLAKKNFAKPQLQKLKIKTVLKYDL